jgi:dolichol kinase
MQDWVISLIIAWLPFLMIIGMAWYVGRQVKRGLVTKDGRSLAEVMAELTNEIKRQNERQK